MAYIDESTINAIRRKHPIKEVVERYERKRLTEKLAEVFNSL